MTVRFGAWVLSVAAVCGQTEVKIRASGPAPPPGDYFGGSVSLSSDGLAYDQLGYSVSIAAPVSGDRLVAGAPRVDHGLGSTYVFELSGAATPVGNKKDKGAGKPKKPRG
jgi:hypothetical protein